VSYINNGGPAFPKHGYDGPDGTTLRDWFATHATDEDIKDIREWTSYSRQEARYIHADAMLEARATKP
jgi:hypothetical protein